MAQATLDAFITKPREADTGAPMDEQDTGYRGEDTPAPKGMPRLHVAGTSTGCRAIDAVRQQHPEAGVFLVTLSWRHNYNCGADQVIVANEPRGAAFDLRPPPKPKKDEPKELDWAGTPLHVFTEFSLQTVCPLTHPTLPPR